MEENQFKESKEQPIENKQQPVENKQQFKESQLEVDMLQAFKKLCFSIDTDGEKEIVELIHHLTEERAEQIFKSTSINICQKKLREYESGTYLHSVRVAVISVCIGKILGYNRDLVNELCLAGLLHDIGKKFVPVEIILKPSKLDEIEKDIIRAHPAMSAYYLRERYKYINEDVLLGVYEHHERLDGTGYPRGLKGEEISEIGRIIAIADVLEAYSSERSYHEARSLEQTIKYLETNTGLDQYIIGQLKEHIENESIVFK